MKIAIGQLQIHLSPTEIGERLVAWLHIWNLSIPISFAGW